MWCIIYYVQYTHPMSRVLVRPKCQCCRLLLSYDLLRWFPQLIPRFLAEIHIFVKMFWPCWSNFFSTLQWTTPAVQPTSNMVYLFTFRGPKWNYIGGPWTRLSCFSFHITWFFSPFLVSFSLCFRPLVSILSGVQVQSEILNLNCYLQ